MNAYKAKNPKCQCYCATDDECNRKYNFHERKTQRKKRSIKMTKNV